MSVYTTEVRYICEYYAGQNESADLTKIDKVVEQSWNKIFGDFPIFDESYRKNLCMKILKHYYFREIGLETVGLWRFYLTQKMNEIMPYYNQLYTSAQIKFNPFYNIDFKKEGSNKRADKGKSSLDNNGSNSTIINAKQRHSDTPQGGLSGIENNNYLTDATIDDSTTTNNIKNNNKSTNEMSSDESFTERTYGFSGTKTQSELLNEYRNTFLNIDLLLIMELRDLFLNIY